MKGLTRPMSARAMDVFASGAFLLFGLTGFIDLLDGLSFPWYKGIAGAVGAVGIAYVLFRNRRQRDGRTE